MPSEPPYVPIASPTYARPPITEAVIEIRVAGDVSEKVQEKIAQRLKKRYPNIQPLHEVEFKIDNTGGNVAIKQTQSKGQLRLTSADQADIVLLKARNLLSARLPLYPGWQVFRDNALENWKAWKAVAPGYDIERLGIRYINRLDLPTGQIRLDDYLRVYPKLDIGAATPISAFMLQVTLPTHLPKWNATVTSTIMTPAPLPDRTSILLDIDVSRVEGIPTKDEELWALIDAARIIKNDLFERSITPATRELFKE